MITTVLLDLDDTLLDFKQTEAETIRKTLMRLGVTPTPEIVERYSAINQRQWELLEEKKLTRDQVLHQRFDILFAELGVRQNSDKTQKIYEKLLGQGCVFVPGAKELMQALYGRYRLYLVSNGTGSVQDSRLRLSRLGTYFDGLFISERMGADKPSRAFFDLCFREIPDFRRAETIILGDSLTSDILGGLNAGIHTCWFNYRGKPPRRDIVPEYTITALDQFPALLARL